MVVRIENTPAGLTAWLSGELDHHAAGTIREQVDHAVERYHPRELTLDFSGVGFMDSSGIALILLSQQRMQLMEGSVVLRNVPEQARRVLDAAGIGRLVSIQ